MRTPTCGNCSAARPKTAREAGSEKGWLLRRSAESVGRESLAAARDASAVAGFGEDLGDEVRGGSGAAHAAAEVRVVQLAIADVADPVEHLALTVGKVSREPGFEQGSHRVGQAQHGVAGEACTCFGGAREHL